MKKAVFFGIALLLLAASAMAWVDTFTISRIDDVDYGNHSRLYFSINYTGFYPFTGQAAIRVYWAKGHAIGNELPQFDNMSLYVPTQGYSWDRVFWVSKPEGLEGEWNLRVDIEDVYQSKIATSNEFTWDFGGGAVEPPAVLHEAFVNWIADDAALGWSTYIVLTNPTDDDAVIEGAYFYAFTGGLNQTKEYALSPRQSVAIDTNSQRFLENAFTSARYTSDRPISVLVLSMHESGLTFQYRVESKQE